MKVNEVELGRNYEVDGLRGWAALVVVCFHFFQETFGRLHPVLHNEVFFVLLNGPMMVQIFFILSGDALSASFFSKGIGPHTAKTVLARYGRLTMPTAISCLLVFVFWSLGLVYNHPAAILVDRQDWLGSFLAFPPSIGSLISYSLAGQYFTVPGAQSYNNFLWTMGWEMLGSILVFVNLLALSFTNKRAAFWVLVVEFLFFFLTQSPLSLFLVGMLLGSLRSSDRLSEIRKQKWNVLYLVGFLLLVLVILPYERNQFPWVVGKLSFGMIPGELVTYFFPVVIVVVIYCSRHLVGFFSNRFSGFLGRLSFPLYIFQFNVLVTFTSWAIVQLGPEGLRDPYLWLIVPCSSLALTLALAWVLSPLERWYLDVLHRWIGSRILKVRDAGSS